MALSVPRALISLPKSQVVHDSSGSLLVKRPYSLFAEKPHLSPTQARDILPFNRSGATLPTSKPKK